VQVPTGRGGALPLPGSAQQSRHVGPRLDDRGHPDLVESLGVGRRSAGGTNGRIPMVGYPAVTADRAPLTESSTATASAGATPSVRPAYR
jgi:hypothetical protein